MKTEETIRIPESKLTKSQKKIFGPVNFTTSYGESVLIKAEVRHDDQCGNGHNTFSITGSMDNGVCGCIHEEIAVAFPELAPFIKWHLISTDGPMHMVANTIYHAGNRDHWGLKKGEFRQHTSRGKHQANGVEGVPHWRLEILGMPKEREIYATEKPDDMKLEARWVPEGIVGDGKERDFKAARHCAVWPEATDEQLSAEPEVLKQMLLDRLPALMEAFKADVEKLGFVY